MATEIKKNDDKQVPVAKCADCDTLGIPPQYVCRQCGKTEFEEAFVPGRGRVYTHTTIRIAPDAFRTQAPYDIAIVDLAPGLRVTARIDQAGKQPVAIGQEVVFDRTDECGYWFRLE